MSCDVNTEIISGGLRRAPNVLYMIQKYIKKLWKWYSVYRDQMAAMCTVLSFSSVILDVSYYCHVLCY